jgi:dipeptidyl aminopeptidase/acylaminoacyl peptidase
VLGAWTGGSTPELRWLDKQAEERVASLHKTFGGQPVSLISRSADGNRALVSVDARAAASVFYLVDFKRGTADVVGEEYPALVGVSLGEVRALTFKARDGSDIPAHLTLPPALKPEKLPLVVLDHQWSKGHEQSMFHPIAQFLATRGYAVLQPQHRETADEDDGKTGVDRWGGLPPGDAADGVRAMIEQGITDPARVCIVGYGGHVALAGAAFTPELYACAVSVNGVSDFPNLISYHRKSGSGLVQLLGESLGRANDEELAAKSPAHAASSVRAPILLMHDTDQTVVPFAQSQTMFAALGGLPPHELVKLPGESTRELRAQSWLRALSEMERFLAKHLSARQSP